MTQTQVKICGVNSEAAFDAVVAAAADYLGLVFFERSPRHVTPAQAAALSSRCQGGPKRVGLFVAPDANAIQAVLDKVQLDVLQLYGSEAVCRKMRAQFGLPVWRAIGVSAKADLPLDVQGHWTGSSSKRKHRQRPPAPAAMRWRWIGPCSRIGRRRDSGCWAAG